MKAICIKQAHILARNSKCDDFVQQIKATLTREPETTIIDCDPVIIDKNELAKLLESNKELRIRLSEH